MQSRPARHVPRRRARVGPPCPRLSRGRASARVAGRRRLGRSPGRRPEVDEAVGRPSRGAGPVRSRDGRCVPAGVLRERWVPGRAADVGGWAIRPGRPPPAPAGPPPTGRATARPTRYNGPLRPTALPSDRTRGAPFHGPAADGYRERTAVRTYATRTSRRPPSRRSASRRCPTPNDHPPDRPPDPDDRPPPNELGHWAPSMDPRAALTRPWRSVDGRAPRRFPCPELLWSTASPHADTGARGASPPLLRPRAPLPVAPPRDAPAMTSPRWTEPTGPGC
jgi:hypothetical protein